MNNYNIGSTIKKIREEKKITQEKLAGIINVSSKTISKWETGRGLPDISIISSLASSLDVSVVELLNGNNIINSNKKSNMLSSSFYVCPICGNVIHTIGSCLVSCCGVVLPNLEVEDENDLINIEYIENEYYVTVNHDNNKEHYISFIAYVTMNQIDLIKIYPEQKIEASFIKKGHGYIYVYCNKHGLFVKKI